MRRIAVSRPMDLTKASDSARNLAQTVTPETLAQIAMALDHVPQTGTEFQRGITWLALRWKRVQK